MNLSTARRLHFAGTAVSFGDEVVRIVGTERTRVAKSHGQDWIRIQRTGETSGQWVRAEDVYEI